MLPNYPQTTLMRTSLTVPNPPVVKSSDGNIYRKTGRRINADFVKPRGRVYVPPIHSSAKGFDLLKPFEKVMDKKLREKGLSAPDTESKAKLFYNQVVAAKGFDGAKPVNFEAIDSADATANDPIVDKLLTYFKALNTGVQPNGQPLSTQDAKLSNDVKAITQDLKAKIANAGLSPQDTAAAGVTPVTDVAPEPFYKKTWVRYAAIAIVALIVLKMIF